VSHEDPRLVALSDGHDHIRADAALLRGRIGRGDIAGARRRLGAFGADLEAHMLKEEQGVFATLAAMEEFAPTIARLRAEHDWARRALVRAAAEADDRVWVAIVEALLSGFALHELEEEYDLFPAAEVALPVGPRPPVG
jgi:Xaa-Pro aminopeptidase